MAILIRTKKPSASDFAKSYRTYNEEGMEGSNRLGAEREANEARQRDLEFKSKNYQSDDPMKSRAPDIDESKEANLERGEDEDKYAYRARVIAEAARKRKEKEEANRPIPKAGLKKLSQPKPAQPEDEDVF